ncbi:MAG: DUF2961 domain-containing protein [Phycisphaerae bacterium]|nr:DUF2961 domain-containing protein [Phycisphaerae bacterium]
MNERFGFNPGLGTLPLMSTVRTRSISAENPTGEKGRGGMAVPDPAEVKPAAAARAADDLGQGWKVRPFLRVNSGQTATLMDVDGPGVIQHIWMVEGLSRAHVLRFYWDGESRPSIEVPAPDFFAVGHELFAPVNSQAVIVNAQNALNCYWPMPFRKHVKVTFTNEAGKDLELLAFQITYAETEVPDNAGYLHAQWRRGMTDKVNPYVIVDGVKGRGRYVGTFLAWTQLETGWFGEGEIKFFMDGDEAFPTICGTGTEDYFCGSFGFASIYTTAYVGTTLPGDITDEKIINRFLADLNPGQRKTMAGLIGKGPPYFWSLYRWHILDPICFEKDLRVTIQALGWGKDGKYAKLSDDIASVAYWYQAEPHAAFPRLPSLAKRVARQKSRIKRVKGALEGEELKVLSMSAGKTTRQTGGLQGGAWSGGAQLWWTGAKPGDALDLAIPVAKAGRHRVKIRLTRACDYGVVQLSLDGRKLGGAIDLYSDVAVPTDVLDLGEVDLAKGTRTLRVEIVGANEKAKKEHMFGLDYVLLEAVK